TGMELTMGNGDGDFADDDLPVEVRVSFICGGPVMLIGGSRRVRRQLFQPLFVIVMEPLLIVIDKYRSGDVHCIDQTQTLGHTASLNEFLDLRRDINKPASIG